MCEREEEIRIGRERDKLREIQREREIDIEIDKNI